MSALLASLLALLALTGAGLVLARPFWAFLPVVMMFALEQLFQSYFTTLQAHTTVFNMGVIVLATLAVCLRVARRDPVFAGLWNPVTILIYLQFVLWLVSMIYTTEEAPPGASLRSSWYYTLLLLVVLPLLITGIEECGRILVGMLVVGTVLAILILLNPSTSYYNGRLIIDLGMMTRRADQIGNPLSTAAMGGTIALIAALIAPRIHNPAFTTLRIAAFVLGLGLAIGSGSRGQVLAMVVAGIMFFPLARKLNNPRNFILSAFGLLIVVGGVVATFQLFVGDQNRQRWDPVLMVKDIALRFDMCWAYLEAWIQSPAHWMFGLGSNAWMGIGASSFRSDYVHNIAVEILCEQGIVGAAVFVTITIMVIRSGMQMWLQYRDDPLRRSVAAILLAICAFELFNALKQGSISSVTPFFWWLVLAKLSFAERRHGAPAIDASLDDHLTDPALSAGYGGLEVARG